MSRLALPVLLCVALLVLALAVAGSRLWSYRVAGFKPLGTVDPAAIESPPAVDTREAPSFLFTRNEVEVEVPRDMRVIEFLRLYDIEHLQHVRLEIAEQVGVETLADGHRLDEGSRYVITLTPRKAPP